MDLIDAAQQLEAEQRQRALKNRVKITGVSALLCIDCDEPIPELRRKTIAGCQRCVDCQMIHEHKMRG